MDLVEKIRNKQARLSVIGLGYVGLPLITEFAHTGFRTGTGQARFHPHLPARPAMMSPPQEVSRCI